MVAVAIFTLAVCGDSLAGETVRVAAISFVPQKFDLDGNADRLERAFRAAKKGGAQIAVGPEGALDGYVVNEIIAGDVPAERMKKVAIKIEGPVVKRFKRLARELEMCLVFGFAERIDADVFNAAVFIDQQGTVCVASTTKCNSPKDTTPRGGSTVRPLHRSLNSIHKGPLVKMGDNETPSFGEHELLKIHDAEIRATFATGDPAITYRKVGRGAIYRFANYPGLSYWHSATKQTGGLLSGFAAPWRDAIVQPTRDAKVKVHVRLDRPLIEAPALHSDKGVAVTLLNWSGQSQNDVEVILHSDRRPIKVVSARRGTLSMKTGSLDVSGFKFATRVQVDLADVDVLSFHYNR